MEGVLILHEYHPTNQITALVMFILMCVVAIVAMILLVVFRDRADGSFGCTLATGIAGFLACILLCTISYHEENVYKTYYKVYCDETVNIREFNEKYEVIEQEGKMYIVEERDTDNKGD